MKLWNTNYISTSVNHRFPVLRLFPATKLSLEEGAFVRSGSLLAAGDVDRVVFRINLKDEFGTTDYSKFILTLKGEVVHEGQLICEGAKGHKIVRIISPVNGVVDFPNDELIITKGKEFRREIIPLEGKFYTIDNTYYEILANSTKLGYNFFLGKLPGFSMEFVCLSKEMEDHMIKGKAVVTAISIFVSLYQKLVEAGVCLIITPGIRFSDYMEIKSIYGSIPVPIVVTNSWGLHQLNESYDLVLSAQEKSKYIHIDSNGIHVNYSVLHNPDGGAYSIVEARLGMNVCINIYPYTGSTGIIKDIINEEQLLVELGSGKEIMLDYRNVSYTDIILG
ncbi:hypothetical protein JW962_02170 [Candidatus Dojkabacteria bacterium]|nr:hypothetical protein [Candidatus Dojkabacteria bacterium]